MPETSGLKTLKQVVEEFLLKSKKPKDEYFRFFQFAIDGLRLLRVLHMKGTAKWDKQTISANGTIAMPQDYVSFIGVVVIIEGQFWYLTEKERLAITTTGGSIDPTAGEGADVRDVYYSGYPDSGGINREGYFKIDEPNRRIWINSTDRTEVTLLYMSSGVNLSGTETYVPVRAVDALHKYILSEDAIFTNPNMASFYALEKTKAIDILKYIEAPSAIEFRDVLYEIMNPLALR